MPIWDRLLRPPVPNAVVLMHPQLSSLHRGRRYATCNGSSPRLAMKSRRAAAMATLYLRCRLLKEEQPVQTMVTVGSKPWKADALRVDLVFDQKPVNRTMYRPSANNR
jgi:hypothetical protein